MSDETKTKRRWYFSWKVILLLVLVILLILQMAGYFTAERLIHSAVWTNAAVYWLAQQWLTTFLPVFAITLVLFDIIIVGLIIDQFRHLRKGHPKSIVAKHKNQRI